MGRQLYPCHICGDLPCEGSDKVDASGESLMLYTHSMILAVLYEFLENVMSELVRPIQHYKVPSECNESACEANKTL